MSLPVCLANVYDSCIYFLVNLKSNLVGKNKTIPPTANIEIV